MVRDIGTLKYLRALWPTEDSKSQCYVWMQFYWSNLHVMILFHLHFQVRMVSQQEVVFAVDREVPIIDIRPPADFDAGHIKGCERGMYLGILRACWGRLLSCMADR